MYYLVNNEDRYDDIDSVLEACINQEYYEEDEDGFEEYIDCEGRVDVCGYEWYPSEILRNMGVYDEELVHWAEGQVDNAYENYNYELRHAHVGDTVYVCNYDVDVCEDEIEPTGDTDGDEEIYKFSQQELEASIEETKAAEQKIYNEGLKSGENFASLMQIIGG